MLEWLEYSSISIWVGESIWGYPIMLGLHVIGLATVVGIFTMLNFRILGLFESLEISSFIEFFKLAWIGLLINAASGFALFSSQATFYVTNIPFLVKISSILMGSIIGVKIHCRLRKSAKIWDQGKNKLKIQDKILAGFSLFVWLGAIFGGRLIAYI
jgi:hypothetical protein